MRWLELILDIDGAHAEAASELLDACGAAAVTFNEGDTAPVLEPAPGDTPLWQRLKLVALFDTDVDTAAIEQSLGALAPDARPGECRWQPLEDRDWSREWLKDYAPMCFGERFWVAPTGMAVPEPDAPAIVLDPGLAFGTGTHETTALCLEWIAQRSWQGERVLDVGCGSGILALAAVRLGARHALAYDIDPQALIATGNNARANGLDAKLTTTDALAGAGRYDVVLANILAGPLTDLAAKLAAQVDDDGELVMSGVLVDQAGALAQAYAPWFDLAPVRQQGDWALLHARRRPRRDS